ncbi:hypothetical protein B0H14DRAFT_3897375 [Mycena olivaceomarginata]|nr:hypothetical protein B0H14DRAFT_3897375 [Mycena olivaceomarginata]
MRIIFLGLCRSEPVRSLAARSPPDPARADAQPRRFDPRLRLHCVTEWSHGMRRVFWGLAPFASTWIKRTGVLGLEGRGSLLIVLLRTTLPPHNCGPEEPPMRVCATAARQVEPYGPRIPAPSKYFRYPRVFEGSALSFPTPFHLFDIPLKIEIGLALSYSYKIEAPWSRFAPPFTSREGDYSHLGGRRAYLVVVGAPYCRPEIPELLQEIAAFVDNPRNLSSFAQMDRFTHAAAAALTSCIFRDAIVRLESIGSLAESFSNAQRAASYGSLPLRGRVSGTVSIVQKLHTDLIAVFLVFSTHGRLV